MMMMTMMTTGLDELSRRHIDMLHSLSDTHDGASENPIGSSTHPKTKQTLDYYSQHKHASHILYQQATAIPLMDMFFKETTHISFTKTPKITLRLRPSGKRIGEILRQWRCCQIRSHH
jgi:hypothetical protein